MKKLTIIILISFIGGLSVNCTRASKSCKASHKKMKKMRKSGQLKM